MSTMKCKCINIFPSGKVQAFPVSQLLFFFLCVDSVLPGLPLFWDSKDVLLCHNKHVHCQKEMFRIPFSSKHTSGPCSRSKGKKIHGYLFGMQCISHSLKLTVHPEK